MSSHNRFNESGNIITGQFSSHDDNFQQKALMFMPSTVNKNNDNRIQIREMNLKTLS